VGRVEGRPGRGRLRALQLRPRSAPAGQLDAGEAEPVALSAIFGTGCSLKANNIHCARGGRAGCVSRGEVLREHIENRRPWRRSQLVQGVSRTDCGRVGTIGDSRARLDS
jgi:hypothetical protein